MSTTHTPQVRSVSWSRSVIWMPLKIGRLADLREADERQVADHFEAAREAVETHDRFVFAAC